MLQHGTKKLFGARIRAHIHMLAWRIDDRKLSKNSEKVTLTEFRKAICRIRSMCIQRRSRGGPSRIFYVALGKELLPFLSWARRHSVNEIMKTHKGKRPCKKKAAATTTMMMSKAKFTRDMKATTKSTTDTIMKATMSKMQKILSSHSLCHSLVVATMLCLFTAKNQKLKAVEEEVIEEHLIEEKVIKKANQFKELAGLSGHWELTHPTTNMKTTYNTTKMQKTYNR